LDAAERAWKRGLSRHEATKGERWWRILRAPSADDAEEYAQACFPSPAGSRFTPVTRGTATVPAAYAGNSETVAFWEIVLRDVRHRGIRRVPEHDTRDRYLVEVTLRRTLALLDVRRPNDANLVAAGKRPPDLTQAWPRVYALTRAWAQALYSRLPDIDGIIYESHQVPGECVVLYQPNDPVVFEVAGRATSVRDEPVRSALVREALKVDGAVDFGDDEDDDA
jgi:hypothetical protein